MILFRCDSSHIIGTGHVIRCLNLAKMLRASGKEVQFLCRADEGNINEKIVGEGFQLHELKSSPGTKADLSYVSELRPEWLVIDSYEIGISWEKQVPPMVKIFVIDDLMNREHQCQVLLDQNYRRNNSHYKQLVPAATRLLLGPQYCLLNPELAKGSPLKLTTSPYKVLVFFGGTDSTSESLRFLEALKNKTCSLQFTLVILNSHRDLQKMREFPLPAAVTLRISPPNWLELLKQHDLFLGSGGTVTWERMFLGLPGAVISVASNQEEPSRDLASAGYQIYLGQASQLKYSEVLSTIERLFDEPSVISKMSQQGLKLVSRISQELLKEIFG